jgi:NAD(P)-dependent dehydrogenase (short-subunit alcohol dehydrogenase family)
MTSDQKVAIITGGSSDIGRATAVTLAKEVVKRKERKQHS